MDIRKPKVLLIGNGILQAFGGESWNDFLKSIRKRDDLPEPNKINCPEPLKAILLTDDRVDRAMRDKCKSILNGKSIEKSLAQALAEILSLGFDHILTTNYTYELEQAAIYPEALTEYKLKKMATSTTGRVENKYLIHTYNKVTFNGTPNKIWHIHGEARKPDSTILGHYYYGNSLFKIKEAAGDVLRLDNLSNEDSQSWVEAFLFGDIYCLGFGFGLAEFDLWWLINRKAREKKNTGKLYFYEPNDNGQWEKIDLLKLLKSVNGTKLVDIIDLDYQKNNSTNWQSFYIDAILNIREKLSKDTPKTYVDEKESIPV